MADVIRFPGERMGGDDGGPEDPMLEQRVDRLEADVGEIKSAIGRIEASVATMLTEMRELKSKDIVDIRTKLSFIEGRLQGMPNTWQLLTLVLTTWAAGAAIVFTLLRYVSE